MKASSVETETEPEADGPTRDGLRGFLDGSFGVGRGPLAPLRRLLLMLRCAAFAASGTASERADRIAVAVAVMRADDRLVSEYGVRLRCSRGALLRLVEMSNPPGRPRVPPHAVVGRRVRAPARRLVYFHGTVRRGGVLRVEEHPGGRVRVVVVRRGSG